MNFFQKIIAIWENISLVQRALLIAIVLTMVIGGFLLTHWAGQPDMRLLYQDLEPDDASKVTEAIADKGIRYELRSGGRAVYAPREHIHQLRLDLAREGLPGDRHSGYKLFDDEKIGVSPFVQNVNLQRALQDELAKSIGMIEGVVHARVHIVKEQQRLFVSEDDPPTASVALRLRPGYRLTSSTIASITHLVSGSVEKLKAENVTIVDSEGRLLSSPADDKMAHGADTVQEYKERVENNLSGKVEEMLTAVLGPGRASVRVSATIDMSHGNRVVEKYDPVGRVISSESIKTNTEDKGSTRTEDGESLSQGDRRDEEITTEYLVGKTVEQWVDMPGAVQGLSVAAMVDLNEEVADEEAEGGLIMPIEDVEGVIRSALGLSESDSLTVVNTRFHRPEQPVVEDEPGDWTQYMILIRHGSLGIMGICALLALKILAGGKSKVQNQTSSSGQLAESETALGLLPGGSEADTSEPAVLRKQIASALQHNPDQVKQLFSNWVEGKN